MRRRFYFGFLACAFFVTGILSSLGFSSAQTVGPEFRVSTFAAGDQAFPAVAMNSSGQFVVAWESAGQDGSGLGVYAQRFSASGEKIGPEFRVNTFITGDQWFAAVALRDDGAFLIAWQSAYQDGDGRGVFAQLFDASGTPLGPEFQVNTTVYSNQAFPDVAVNPVTKGFVLTWSSAFQDDVHDAVIQRLFDASGVPTTAEFVVNEHTLGFQGYSRVDCDAVGNFVIAYTSWLLDGDQFGIGARRYRADGTHLDSEYLVNDYYTLSQDYPDVAVSTDGGFVIAWHSTLQDGYGYGVYHRRYDKNGYVLSGEIPVNTTVENNQWWPKIAVDDFGSYTIVWQSDQQDGSGRGVYARRYRSDGSPHTSEFRVNTYTSGDQERPVVACDPVGNLVVIWHSRLQDGSGFGVYAQRFTAGTVPVAFLGVTAEAVDGTVVLRWRVAGNGRREGWRVYRRSDGDFVRIAGFLPPDVFEYVDDSVEPGMSYLYRIGLVDESGDETVSSSAAVTTPDVDARLFQNHPNPFNSSTTIGYSVDFAGPVSLRVYDMSGRLVRTLVDGFRPVKSYTEMWDGRDDLGNDAASGVYFCNLSAGGVTLSKKMLKIR